MNAKRTDAYEHREPDHAGRRDDDMTLKELVTAFKFLTASMVELKTETRGQTEILGVIKNDVHTLRELAATYKSLQGFSATSKVIGKTVMWLAGAGGSILLLLKWLRG